VEFPFENLRLGILTHVEHWQCDGKLLSKASYVREANLWLSLFRHCVIVAPLMHGAPRKDSGAYTRQPDDFRPCPMSRELPGVRGNLIRLVQTMRWARATARLLRDVDVVHLRIPSLAGLPAQLMRRRDKVYVTKYHQPWGGWYEQEIWLSKLQRRLVLRGFPGGVTLVYGPSAPPHIIEFFPACMYEGEVRASLDAAKDKRFEPPWRILIVGRLVPIKHMDLALKALICLRHQFGLANWKALVIGDGEQRPALERLVREGQIADAVEFKGGLPFDHVLREYQAAHILIMPGQAEAFPKPLVEACASRVVPVAAAAGINAHILGNGRYGVTANPDPASMAQELANLMQNPERMGHIAEAGHELAFRVTMDSFRRRLIEVVQSACELKGLRRATAPTA
jgi:glycosyltransferase involved in cell wall biosynthesis